MERLLAASHERKGSVFAAMKNPAVTTTFQTKTRESIEAFVEFIERTQALLDHRTGVSPVSIASVDPESGDRLEACPTLSEWANHFLDEIGYFNELRRGEKNPEAAENRIRNLKELMVTMDNSGSPTQPAPERLHAFLEDITLDTEREEEDEKPGDAVTLITMHSCKGLEFPHVYVVGLEDGLLPHSRSKVEGTLDEERRLFYVAITRAMQTLTISHCGGRKKYGQMMPCHPSQFLKELPPELIEHADEKAKTPVPTGSGKDMFAAMRDSIG
jgi:superfamily I DNA/RNA helicase